MKFVLCDDNKEFVRELKLRLEHYFAVHDWICECETYSNPLVLLDMDLSDTQTIFLDIDMPELNGMELAASLRNKYPDLLIIFVTAFIEYAPEGYRLSALRYLLKNDLDKGLSDCMEAICERLLTDDENIEVETVEESIWVRLKDILYIEGTAQRHVILHTYQDKSVECIGTLASFEARLTGKGYLRIQRSYLVNMQHIKYMRNYSVILDNGIRLKVSELNYSKKQRDYILWKGNQI